MTKNSGDHREGFLRERGHGIGLAVTLLLLFAYYSFTWRSISAAKAAIDTCGGTFCDFASFYYPMGEAIFRTGLPVTRFVYSPFIAIMLSIFPPLGLKASFIFWGLLQALSLVLYVVLFRRLVPSRSPIQFLFTALALSSFPVLHILSWGQVGLFTTIAILAALLFYERGQPVMAAALLAFGLGFKFFPIIFLVPFAVRRDIRFLLIAAAASGLFLLVIPGILLGIDGALRFYSALLHSYSQMDWVITNYNSQHFPHVLLRLLQAIGVHGYAYLPLLRWIGYTLMAVNMGLIYLIQRGRQPHANLWSFHVLFLSIPFILPTSWPVDLVYLPFGQGLLAWHLFDGETFASKTAFIPEQSQIKKGIVLSLLLLSVAGSNIVFFNLVGNRVLYGSAGFIFWSNLLLLAASYMELPPEALRQIRMARGDNLQHLAQGGYF